MQHSNESANTCSLGFSETSDGSRQIIVSANTIIFAKACDPLEAPALYRMDDYYSSFHLPSLYPKTGKMY